MDSFAQSRTRQAATWLNVVLGLLIMLFGGYFILHTVVRRASMTGEKAWTLALASSFLDTVFRLAADSLTKWD